MSFEVTNICRTCLGLDGLLLSIYDSKGSNGSGCIADMLRGIINMNAKKSDGMPEKVCLMCISEINRCYSFKMKCDNSDKTLRQLLNIPKETILLTLPKTKSKAVTESNIVSKDCDEHKKLTKQNLAEENQVEVIKEDSLSPVTESNIIFTDPNLIKDKGSTLFSVHSEDNEVIEEENKSEEILDDDLNSGDYSIIFTKFVNETHEEAQMIDDGDLSQKEPPHPLILECSSKETKLESKCSMCPMSFVHTRNLKKHIVKVHNISEIRSTDIAKDTCVLPLYEEELEFSAEEIENRDEEEGDLQLIDEIEDNIAKQEPQLVSQNQNIENHFKELHCPRCTAIFAMHSSLNIHIKLNKCQSPQFSCGDCKKVFISMKSLKEHMKTHKFFCETCGETLDSNYELAKHREEHQGINPKHQCPNCKKVFTMRSTLNDHMRIHTGEKPFVCDLCGKAFSQNANLKQHVMRHNKTKPFKCDQCNQSFVSKGELYAHLRSHNRDQPFRCDSCPSAFTTSSSLVKHKRIHTGERPYSCEFCPMRFTALNTLKNHRRTHTGEKPYKCKFCPRAFAQKSDCSIHIRTHTGERRHSCNICNMKFQQSGTLRTHMKTHIPKVQRSQPEVEKQKEHPFLELDIIEIETGQEMLEKEQDRRKLQTRETSPGSEEGMEISQDELLHFNIEECDSGNSVFSGE